jgi:hypothetical protein
VRKTRLALILLMISPLLTTGIAAHKPAPDFYPLAVGNSWTYRHEEGSEFTVKVVEAEKQPDGTVQYKVDTQAGVLFTIWYSKTTDMVLMHRKTYADQEGVKVNYEPVRQFLRNPLTKGAKWRWAGNSEVGMPLSESSEVVGQEKVKVQAGTFKAMKVLTQVMDGDAAKTRTDWYAEGVGLVKSMSEGRGLKYGWELISYSHAKK